MNPPKTERNERLYALRQEGVSFGDLGIRFGISATRARAIVLMEEARRQRERADA